jgi:hypothetical protein
MLGRYVPEMKIKKVKSAGSKCLKLKMRKEPTTKAKVEEEKKEKVSSKLEVSMKDSMKTGEEKGKPEAERQTAVPGKDPQGQEDRQTSPAVSMFSCTEERISRRTVL